MIIPSSLIDVVLPESGYPDSIQLGDTRDVLMQAAADSGAIVTAFPPHLWIEPKGWAEVAELNDQYRIWPLDYVDRFTNQGSGNGGYSTHECTTHAFRACFESCRNRQRMIGVGPPVPGKRLDVSATSASVWISPLSLYAEANPREWGGAGVRQILSIASRRGCLPDKIQPREYSFKHAIQGTCGAGGINQSRGKWVDVGDFPDGWKETSKHFRPLEYIFPETWEQTVCLVLNGFAVGVGRSGHSVPYLRWDDTEKLMQYADSYDLFRYDSVSNIRATVGGSYAIVSVTTPDSWDKPAGE